MTLFESGHAPGAVSLAALLRGETPRSQDAGLTVAAIAQRVAVGGWPGFLDRGPEESLQAVPDYLEEVRRIEIGRVDRRRRDPAKVGRFLRSLARNAATYASTATLAADAGGADCALKEETAREHLATLERLMIVEDQPPWAPHQRSRPGRRASSRT